MLNDKRLSESHTKSGPGRTHRSGQPKGVGELTQLRIDHVRHYGVHPKYLHATKRRAFMAALNGRTWENGMTRTGSPELFACRINEPTA